MPLTRRSLRSSTNAKDKSGAVETIQPRKGKKPPSSTKAPAKSQQLESGTKVLPQVDVAEAVRKEKAVHLAEIEDELAQKAKKAKIAHPRRRAPQAPRIQDMQGLEQRQPPQEQQANSLESGAPSSLEDRNSPVGALEPSEKSTHPELAQLAGPNSGENLGDSPAKEAAKCMGIEPAEGAPVDNDGGMNDSDSDTDGNNEVFGGSTVPPLKTPGKNRSKAVEGRKKTGASNLRMQVKLNCKVPSSGSTFQNSLVNNSLFDTPATKKNLTNSVQAWTQGIPAPPAKKQKVSNSKSRSVTLVAASNEPIKLVKSVKSCTTVIEPTRNLSPPSQRSQPQEAVLPPRGKKRQAEESDTPSNSTQPLRKQNQITELSSDGESNSRLPSQKRSTAVAHTSKHYSKGKSHRHALPPPLSHKTAHTDETSASSDQSDNDTGVFLARNRPTKGQRTTSRYKQNSVELLTSDSDNETLARPKRKSQAVSGTKNRLVEDFTSGVEEVELPSTLYGGLQDEDDTMERKAAVASPVHPRAAARKSKASVKIKPEITAAPRNSSLPAGALEHNRWSKYFLPTFLKYVGGMRHEIWTLDEREIMGALQAIWNRIYSGEKPIGGTKVVHVVGFDVYSVVTQRLTEWRNAIGSTALMVVNDYFDSQKFYTTEKRQQAAVDLLFCERYVYHRTRDVSENGVKKLLKNGRYRGPLIINTVAQHLIETENAINVPGLIEDDDFPKAAIALSAVAVHRALELWEKGYITYESYYEAKTKNLKTGGITKAVGPDGKVKKTTNFGRKQCERWSDQHCSDIWLVDDGKMQMIVADARKVVDTILARSSVTRQGPYADDEAGPSHQVRKMVCIESDPEFW